VTFAVARLGHKKQYTTLEPEYLPGNRGQPLYSRLQAWGWGTGLYQVHRLLPLGTETQSLSYLFILGSTVQSLPKHACYAPTSCHYPSARFQPHLGEERPKYLKLAMIS
jgi:hypothetical protein